MARNELAISISYAFECRRCPNRKKVEGLEYPYTDFPTCPRDELIKEVGANPTADQLMAAVRKYDIKFSGQVGWSTFGGKNADLLNLECPNAEGGVPGIIMTEIQVSPVSSRSSRPEE